MWWNVGMRVILQIALLAGVAATLTIAADKPNYSGTWKCDLQNSDFAGAPGPTSLTRTIQHVEPSLILTDDQTGAQGSAKVVRTYKTDGTETTYQSNGSDVKSAAHWEGNTIVIVGKVNAGGTDIVISGPLTLSPDGKTLTESDKIVVNGSEVGALKIVFTKQ